MSAVGADIPVRQEILIGGAGKRADGSAKSRQVHAGCVQIMDPDHAMEHARTVAHVLLGSQEHLTQEPRLDRRGGRLLKDRVQ